MELGFNVKAGPLSQISLHILSLDRAVYLATGAYGWWKAKERSKSLELVLGAANAHLVSTSSFNWNAYQRSREHDSLEGFVVQSGGLHLTSLPKASTAKPPDAGMACLRALTTGLLCFYSVEATTTVLCEVIPSTLLKYDQEDEEIEMEGPFLTSLKHFVSAVAAEEDNNRFRQYLVHEASLRQFTINGVSTHEAVMSEAIDMDEKPFVVGMLHWMLTPAHRRHLVNYPTRSLRVWLISVVMVKLGFQVSFSLRAVGTQDDYEKFVNRRDVPSEYADVILITAPVGDTDPLMLNRLLPGTTDPLKPQIIPIRGVPWLAFRRARDNNRKANLTYLADVWEFSYKQAYAVTLGIVAKPDKHCRIMLKQNILNETFERESPSEFQETLISDWTVHLFKICAASLTRFVPRFENSRAGWDAHAIRSTYYTLQNMETPWQPTMELNSSTSKTAAEDNCLILCAIVLGTIYGVASRCILENTNTSLTLDSEIAFRPDLVYKWFDLHGLARVIGQAIDGTLDSYQWIDFVLDISLGHSLLSFQRPLGNIMDIASRVTFGGVANGMSAVSRVLVKPSARQAEMITMYIQRGVLLNIPTTDEGLIIGLSRGSNPLLHSLTLDPEPELEKLVFRAQHGRHQTYNNGASSSSLRIDVEPSWEADPRQVVFRVRDRGRVIGTIDMNTVFLRAADAWVECTCSKKYRSSIPGQNQDGVTAEVDQEITVPLSQRWQQVDDVRQILTPYGAATMNGQVAINDTDKVFLDVGADDMALLVAIGALRVRKLAVGLGCLPCAYESIKNKEDPESAAIIMVSENIRTSSFFNF